MRQMLSAKSNSRWGTAIIHLTPVDVICTTLLALYVEESWMCISKQFRRQKYPHLSITLLYISKKRRRLMRQSACIIDFPSKQENGAPVHCSVVAWWCFHWSPLTKHFKDAIFLHKLTYSYWCSRGISIVNCIIVKDSLQWYRRSTIVSLSSI